MSKRSFLDSFPAPAFLQMPSVGFSIADSAIRAINFKKGKVDLEIDQYGETPIPEGVVSAGHIHKPKELVALVAELKKAHDMRYIRATLPEEKAYLFTARLPMMNGSEVRGSIESIIEENVPLLVSESVFDYETLRYPKESKEHIDVSVSVLPTTAVMMYQNVFDAANLVPVHYEIESQAIAKSVVPRSMSEPCVLIHLCRAKVGLYIVYGGTVNFTSTLSIAPVNLDPFSEEVINAETAFVTETYPIIEDVVLEIRKLFSFWESQSDKFKREHTPIKKALVCGSFANVPGIDTFLSSKTNLEVSIANVWENAFSLDTYVPPISKNDALGFATAIGVALPKYKHV